MNLNTQQLQYLVEIERTRSISQAAANLYMGQPNLSRLLRDVESALGFPIFERTRKGVRPTEKGAVFLQHARNILREADFIQRMGPASTQPNRFRVCLPRSHGYVSAVHRYLSRHPQPTGLDAMIRECHPRQALEQLEGGYAEIAVIRYCQEYQDYFSEQAAAKELHLVPLGSMVYLVTLSQSHPLASLPQIAKSQLLPYTELVHRDTFFSQKEAWDQLHRIYALDRMAQLQFLQTFPGAYLWTEPLPQAMLRSTQLVQRPCPDNTVRYRLALAYNPQGPMSPLEKGFLDYLTQEEIFPGQD